MIKKCPECQFEPSQFGTYKYTPHAPGCSRANLREGECKNCGLTRATCEMPDGDEWVKNCQKIEGKKHEFGVPEGEKELRKALRKVFYPCLEEVWYEDAEEDMLKFMVKLEARKEEEISDLEKAIDNLNVLHQAELTTFKEKVRARLQNDIDYWHRKGGMNADYYDVRKSLLDDPLLSEK